MNEEEIQIPSAKGKPFSFQSSTDYYFTATYQYEGPRKAAAITKTIHDNFLLPCWVQRYWTKETFNVKTQRGVEQKEQLASNYLNMLDCKTLQLSPEGKLQFSILDKNELQEMRQIRQLNQEYQGDAQVENFRKEAILLYSKWENFLKYLQQNADFKNTIFKIVSNIHYLKIFIVQRFLKGQFKTKVSASQPKTESETNEFFVEEFFFYRELAQNFPSEGAFSQGQNTYTYSEKNVFLPCFYDTKSVEKPFELNITMTFEKENVINADRKLLYYRIPQNTDVKVLKITFQIADKAEFFTSRIKVGYTQPEIVGQEKVGQSNSKNYNLQCFTRFKYYEQIGPIESRNKVTYPYQESKFQRNKIALYKHFHLAFQGGGAKGLAYVGAYKSIREQKATNIYKKGQNGGKQRITIKSIMGSSAGGIIALAISTGIPEYELQKICYKMNSIPSTDRFSPSDPESSKAKDDYGNDVTIQTIKQSLVRIFDQYGIVQKDVTEKFLSFVSDSQQSRQIQDKLLNWLAINSNAMAQILTLQYQDQVQPGFFSKLFGKAPEKKIRKKINWEGLLLHGALMKGEAIHDIAKDCVVKFLFKERMYQSQKQFTRYLQDCEDPDPRKQEFKFSGIKLNDYLRQQITFSRHLLQVKLQDVWNAFGGKTKEEIEAFGTFLIGLVNRFLVLLDNYYKLISQSKGLILLDRSESKVLTNHLPFKKEIFAGNELIQYFKTCFLLEKNINSQDIKMHKVQLEQYTKNLVNGGILNTKEGEKRLKNLTIGSRLFIDIENQKLEQLSYNEINSLLNRENLIDPSHLDFSSFMQNREGSGENLIEYLCAIFGEQLKRMDIEQILEDDAKARFERSLEQQEDSQINHFFYSLEASQSIYEVYQLLKPTLAKLKKQQDTIFHKAIHNYEANLRAFKQQVAKINMREYNRLTGIELSCTSVDLDNKVLRFFNQKTTPLLPVCRSVQMTGSFPVGFKAQKWREEWGMYHVFSLEQKHVIDITGHEFTDGGLLANFPIKYMDNDLIRKRYFAQKAVAGQTILLGFGLDYLDESRYQLTEKQLKSLKQQKKKSAIAMEELKNIFGLWTKLSGGLSVFFNTKGGKGQVKWSQIEHWLIKQIPLLRFGLKIAQAYPNADRNLNFQAFDNKVLVQQMWPDWKNGIDHMQNHKAEMQSNIKQFVDFYHLHLKKRYDQFNEGKGRIEKNLKVENFKEKVDKYFRQVNYFIEQRQADIVDRNNIVQEQFNALFQPQNYQHFKDILAESENLSAEKAQNDYSTSTLSLSLINIFYIHLRIKQNRPVVDRYNKYYTFMKFIAEDFSFQAQYQKKAKTITTASDISITEDLNRININNLYEQQNFEEIARHLGFENYHAQYYSQFMKKYEKALTIENQQKFKQEKKQQTQQRLRKEYSKDSFTDMKVFDVTDSIKRLTQVIYLLVKGRDERGKLKGAADIRRLTSHVKSTNYKDLFFNEKEGQLKKNQGRQNAVQPLYYCQIIDFFKRQIAQFEKGTLDLVLTDAFYNFIKQYDFQNHQNMKIRYLQGLIQHRNSKIIHIHKNSKDISGSDEENQDQGTIKWLQRQYKFVIKYKSREALLERMKIMIKEDLLNNRNKSISTTAKILFQVLQERQPKGQDKAELQQIDDLLIFILDDVDLKEVFGASIERQEMIKRKKRMAEGILLTLLRSYQAPGKGKTLPEEINFVKGIINRRSFIQYFKLRNKPLKTAPVNYKQNDGIPKQNKKPSPLDTFSLRLVELEAIYLCVKSKINTKIEQAKATNGENYSTTKLHQLDRLNQSYYYDVKYLIDTLKELIFLTKSIVPLQRGSRNDLAQTIADRLQAEKVSKNLVLIYRNILRKFVPKYYSLEQLSLSEISKSKISEPFIIEFQKINTLAQSVYKNISEIYYLQKYKTNIQSAEKEYRLLNVTREENIVRYVYTLLAKMIRHKFSLPLLDIQWELSAQSTGQIYQQKVYNILALQFYKKINGFSVPVVNFDQKQNLLFQVTPYKEVDSDVHLILQGVQSSNNYFGGLYQNIGRIMVSKNAQTYELRQAKMQLCLKNSKSKTEQPKKLDQEHIRDIKAITCANFHSVFGFLLAMGLPIEEIRKEMFKLKYVTNVIENQVITDQYFDSFSWANNTSHRHKYLIQELQKHNTKFMDRVDSLRKKDFQYTLLPKEYEDLKLIYLHEKQLILQTEARILDETTENINQIANSFESSQYALQISKKFGYNYICDLQHKHKYSDLSKESFESFKKIAQTIFSTFGSLIQGILSNALASHTAINITNQNAKYVAKGLLINRLLSTFKLNDYITKKLKESRLSPNISLAQFYQVSKRKIFLNFTVIDVNRQRLAFLNKNTMPNMPLWAAIIATSSLPFFHQFFEANKEWQATDASSFYDFFVYQFFKADQDKNTRITQYTSGNFISSVPLQLLTNNTLRRKIFDPVKDKHIINIPEFAICFNPSNQISKLCDVTVRKQYINLSTFGVFKGIASGIWSGIKGIPGAIGSALVRKNPHENQTYNIKYSPGEYISKWLGSTTFMTTFSILSNSNDNFILKWYYDKLIRLPIKIDTLNFHEIVQGDILNRYKVNVLSQKAQQTIERSYEITSSFIYNIVQRSIPIAKWQAKLRKQQKPKQSQSLDSSPSNLTNTTQARSEIRSVEKINQKILEEIMMMYKQTQRDRFKVRFRAQLLEIAHPNTGFKRLYFKLTFLNHSKWNHNNYNNFVVEYAVDEGEDLYGNRKTFKRANQSQVSWMVESNTIITLRFYYLLKETCDIDKHESQTILKMLTAKDQDMQIRETEVELDLKDIVKKLPLRDSYDYQFHYGWEQNFEPQWTQVIKPIKRNKLAFTQGDCGEDAPFVSIRIIGEEDNQQFKTKHIIKKTTSRKTKKKSDENLDKLLELRKVI